MSAVVPATTSPQPIPAITRSAVSVTPTVSPAKPQVTNHYLLKLYFHKIMKKTHKSLKGTFCLSCNSMLFYKNKCYPNSCPSGSYAENGVCFDCSSACLTCVNNRSSCLSCKPGLFLFSNTCVSSCSNGYFPQTVMGSGVCTICDSSCLTC